jgi:hypothetical protein
MFLTLIMIETMIWREITSKRVSTAKFTWPVISAQANMANVRRKIRKMTFS